MQLTVISNEIVVVGYKVLAEMSDGSIVELSCPWGSPKERDIAWQWRCRTREQLTELARAHNALQRAGCNLSLHQHKERVYGHGYAARGY